MFIFFLNIINKAGTNKERDLKGTWRDLLSMSCLGSEIFEIILKMEIQQDPSGLREATLMLHFCLSPVCPCPIFFFSFPPFLLLLLLCWPIRCLVPLKGTICSSKPGYVVQAKPIHGFPGTLVGDRKADVLSYLEQPFRIQ